LRTWLCVRSNRTEDTGGESGDERLAVARDRPAPWLGRSAISPRAGTMSGTSPFPPAALAHLAEQPSCKGQATRSRRVGGSTFRDRLIGKTQRFGRCRCWSESSSRNYASLAQWQSVSSVRTRRRIGTCRRPRVTVVSAASTRPCQGLSASSNLVGHSMRWWRNADALVPGTSGPEGS
jgi:hypothetical protein